MRVYDTFSFLHRRLVESSEYSVESSRKYAAQFWMRDDVEIVFPDPRQNAARHECWIEPSIDQGGHLGVGRLINPSAEAWRLIAGTGRNPRANERRAQYAHPDLGAGQLGGKRLGQADHGELRGIVRRYSGRADQTRHGRGIDDVATFSVRLYVRQERLDAVDRTHKIDPEMARGDSLRCSRNPGSN
jgi:hypothetical protein